MNRPDFEEFAALWQEADAAEAADFDRMARQARRQGRFLAYADMAWALLLVGGTIFGMLMAPGPYTMTIALVLLVVTVWLTWKRRRIRQMTRTLDTANRKSFLDRSVGNARADLRRVTLSMLVFPLLVPLGILAKLSFRAGSDVYDFGAVMTAWVQSTRGIVTLILLALVMGYMTRSRLKIKGELRRLEELRHAYAEERAAEEAFAGLGDLSTANPQDDSIFP